MSRRATLDTDTSWTDEDALPPDPSPARSAATRPWGGSGGRWFVWVLRVVAWAVLLIIGYRGVTAIIEGSRTSASPPPAAGHSSSSFPAQLAQAYVLNFGTVYLNFSPSDAARRSAQLAAYLPGSNSGNQLGWDGSGTEHLQAEQVQSVQQHAGGAAVVTLLAQVNNKMIDLAVPVYAHGGDVVISGEPAVLAAPPRAVLPAASQVNTDQSTVNALSAQLQPFFRAYASGDQVTLGRFLASGASMRGLGGLVSFGSIQNLTVPYGGDKREITVVVNWNMNSSPAGAHAPAIDTAPAGLQVTYRMTVIRQGTSWYVQSIGASPTSPGPP
jgi:hypothetical protein